MKNSQLSAHLHSSRRHWLQTMGLLGGSILGWPRIGTAEPKDQAVAPLKRAVRLAHITDVHVQPELGATEGFVKCLHHIQAQSDAPGLILNTGDCIMDSMHRKEPRTKLQWDIWNCVLSEECSTPIEHAIGNHDCWGIDKLKSGTTGGEPLWGKQWALDALGLTKRYRSFDRNGWHFIVLDSVEPYQDGYKAKLDEEQMAWLKSDLEAVSKEVPILVMSHIPIVSPGGILNGTRENPERDLVIPGGTMHLDSKEIHALLSSKGNVKLCLSGHLHILDRAEYDGITYISSGAVSSGWWKKVHMGRFDYGYALVDLFTNGTFQFSYVPFGWRTKQSQT